MPARQLSPFFGCQPPPCPACWVGCRLRSNPTAWALWDPPSYHRSLPAGPLALWSLDPTATSQPQSPNAPEPQQTTCSPAFLEAKAALGPCALPAILVSTLHPKPLPPEDQREPGMDFSRDTSPETMYNRLVSVREDAAVWKTQRHGEMLCSDPGAWCPRSWGQGARSSAVGTRAGPGGEAHAATCPGGTVHVAIPA